MLFPSPVRFPNFVSGSGSTQTLSDTLQVGQGSGVGPQKGGR